MELIVDANVLLAAFLKDALTRELLLDSRLCLSAPEYLISEISRHLKRNAPLRKRIGLSSEELDELFEILTRNIKTYPKRAYASHLKEALSLAPHEEDAPYLALALFLDSPVWSNDQGLKNQEKVRIYTTSELLNKLTR